MEAHSNIIKRLGGIREVARMLGHQNHTTVQGWAERNRIPVERWTDLVQAARRSGRDLDPTELMPAELRGAA